MREVWENLTALVDKRELLDVYRQVMKTSLEAKVDEFLAEEEEWGLALLPAALEWVEKVTALFTRRLCGFADEGQAEAECLIRECRQFATETVENRRISRMFDIIVDYPDR